MQTWEKNSNDHLNHDLFTCQNAASMDPPPADTTEIDDAAAKLQTFTPRDSPVYDISQGKKLAIVFQK